MTFDDILAGAARVSAWVRDAACRASPALRRELEGFNGLNVSQEALALCEVCPVRVECIVHSYEFDGSIEFGYYGGLSPSERDRHGDAYTAVKSLVSEGRLPKSALRKVRRAELVGETDD